jgi:hypothetical protein
MKPRTHIRPGCLKVEKESLNFSIRVIPFISWVWITPLEPHWDILCPRSELVKLHQKAIVTEIST